MQNCRPHFKPMESYLHFNKMQNLSTGKGIREHECREMTPLLQPRLPCTGGIFLFSYSSILCLPNSLIEGDNNFLPLLIHTTYDMLLIDIGFSLSAIFFFHFGEEILVQINFSSLVRISYPQSLMTPIYMTPWSVEAGTRYGEQILCAWLCCISLSN